MGPPRGYDRAKRVKNYKFREFLREFPKIPPKLKSKFNFSEICLNFVIFFIKFRQNLIEILS